MKNKNLILIAMIILGLFFAAVSVSASVYDYPQIEVTMLSQDPDPVEPGETVMVKFKVENAGKETTQDVIIRLNPKFPFSLYGDSAEKNVGKLQADSTGADAAIVQFELKVDEQAVEKETEIEVEAVMGETSRAYTDNEFTIDIQTRDAVLSINTITYEPELATPGKTSKVSLILKNNADSALKNIKVKMDMSGSTIPFAPYQSSSEKIIPLLRSNYQQVLIYNLIAEPDAAAGLYKIPLNITYSDEQGNSYSSSDIVAMSIGEKPKVNLYVKKSTIYSAGGSGKITIELSNAGNTDLKYVEMTLLESDDYQLISTHDYFYLGNLASDDTQSEEIDLYFNSKVKTVNIPVRLKFSDANNRDYTMNYDLKLNTFSNSQLIKFGLKQASYAWVYVVIIILAIGGIVAYRKYKKEGRLFDYRRIFGYKKK